MKAWIASSSGAASPGATTTSTRPCAIGTKLWLPSRWRSNMLKAYGAACVPSWVRKIARQAWPPCPSTSRWVMSSKRCAVPWLMAVLAGVAGVGAMTSPNAANAAGVSVCATMRRLAAEISGEFINELSGQADQRLVAAVRPDDGEAERRAVQRHQRQRDLRTARQAGQAQHAHGLVAVILQQLFGIAQQGRDVRHARQDDHAVVAEQAQEVVTEALAHIAVLFHLLRRDLARPGKTFRHAGSQLQVVAADRLAMALPGFIALDGAERPIQGLEGWRRRLHRQRRADQAGEALQRLHEHRLHMGRQQGQHIGGDQYLRHRRRAVRQRAGIFLQQDLA